ncbi:hypothetical protein U8607_24095 [Methylobacterium durans]|uniref:protein kinase domain-containing protein n=1 Tax=Methylobacterium durans TaxID=2202825 RepID=UPI002AFF48B5|nr:hypothetical protein [Methylobacterium durans]MEA1835172.1 hypothetical protein [Methylobacterium durans]
MKASDLGLLTDENASFFERMTVALQAHKFEREILEHCRGNNMDRVVVALDYGDAPVEYDGARDGVFYLVFEIARCDVRVQVDQLKRFNLAWGLTALHDLAVAIQQLHRGKVSHNDIKPSNLLVFDEELQKLADLGRATSPLMPALHDDECCVGDPQYAAPEVLYAIDESSQAALCEFDHRRASDIYHLGSMTYFFITGRMLTPEVRRRMAPEHRPSMGEGGWLGTYEAVLPFWREAYSVVLEEFKENLVKEANGIFTPLSQSIFESVTHLCEPDPKLRGHPRNRIGHQDQFSVDRYVSLFNFLRKEVMVRSNA